MIFKEFTPVPPHVPNNEDNYILLRVWLEMTIRGLFDMARDTHEILGYGDFTEGSIIFADSEGKLAEDNDNLFYDDTNNRAGIGTNTPARRLEVLDDSAAQLRLTHTATSKYVEFLLDTNSDLTIKPTGSGQIILQPTTDSTDFFQVLDADGGTPIVNVDATNERLGIGLAAPRDTIEVKDRIVFDPTTLNTLIGNSAGITLGATGLCNTVLGHQSLYYNVTGDHNVCVGHQAGAGASGQSYSGNVFVGSAAGFSITTGGSNTAIGYQAAYNITSSDNCLYIGYQAGYSGTIGGSNTCVGYQAGYYNNTGSNNTIMGYQAGGYGAGSANAISGCIAIGTGALYSANTTSGTIGIGTWAAYYTTTGNSCVAIGGNAMLSNGIGDDNVCIGASSGMGPASVSSHYRNTFVGTGAGRTVTTGTDNVAIGYYANESVKNASGHVAVGRYALGNAEGGGWNVAVGYEPARLCNGGSFNIALGYKASYYNATGNNNVCIGKNAGYGVSANSYGNNTYIGYEAAIRNTTGGYNVAVGQNAGAGNSTGTENVFIGSGAGSPTTGSYDQNYNVIIGAEAGGSLTTGDSNVFLGRYAAYRQTSNSNLFILDNQFRTLLNHEEYQVLLYGVFDADSSNQNLTANADVVIRNESTMGSECLNETDFATHANWDTTGDFDDTGGDATYTHNTGAGTLTQTSVNMAVAGVGNRWYRFNYTISSKSGDGVAEITAAFASVATALNIIDGTHTAYFKSAAAPGDFVISATSTTGGFILDDVSLKEMQGGNLDVCGQSTINIVSGTTPPTAAPTGRLFLDTDAGANGTLLCYSNGAWRTVAAL